jgi:hypothetical protein
MAGVIVAVMVVVIDGVALMAGVIAGVIDAGSMSVPGGKSVLYCWMTASVRSRFEGTQTTPPSLRSRDECVALRLAHAPQDVLHAVEDALRELGFALRELLLELDVLALQLDERLLVRLHATFERLTRQDVALLLDLGLHALEIFLRAVELGLTVAEDALETTLGGAAVLGLVHGTLEIDDRDADLRVEARGHRGGDEGDEKCDGVSREIHGKSVVATRSKQSGQDPRSEGVADGELELDGVFPTTTCQGDAPFEAEWAHR